MTFAAVHSFRRQLLQAISRNIDELPCPPNLRHLLERQRDNILVIVLLRTYCWVTTQKGNASRLTRVSFVMAFIGYGLLLAVLIGSHVFAGVKMESGGKAGLYLLGGLCMLASFVLFVVGLAVGISDNVKKSEKSILTYLAMLLNGLPFIFIILNVSKCAMEAIR